MATATKMNGNQNRVVESILSITSPSYEKTHESLRKLQPVYHLQMEQYLKLRGIREQARSGNLQVTEELKRSLWEDYFRPQQAFDTAVELVKKYAEQLCDASPTKKNRKLKREINAFDAQVGRLTKRMLNEIRFTYYKNAEELIRQDAPKSALKDMFDPRGLMEKNTRYAFLGTVSFIYGLVSGAIDFINQHGASFGVQLAGIMSQTAVNDLGIVSYPGFVVGTLLGLLLFRKDYVDKSKYERQQAKDDRLFEMDLEGHLKLGAGEQTT